MDPAVAAQEANYMRYATGNRDALPLLDPPLASDPSIYPPPEIMQKLEPAIPLGAQGRRRREAIWKALRSEAVTGGL